MGILQAIATAYIPQNSYFIFLEVFFYITVLIVTCANFHLKSGNFLHAVLLILCCHRTYIKVKYYAYKLWPSRISGLVPHAHNSIRYVGLTRTQLCMHAYYTACMYHGKKEGSKRRYIGIHFAICIQDLLGSSGNHLPLPFPSLHQWKKMSWPCWTFSINSLYCSTLDHGPAPTTCTVVVVVELFTNYAIGSLQEMFQLLVK